MHLIMDIAGTPFISIALDFTGKETVEDRQLYTEQLAAVLEEEYAPEITRRGGGSECYVVATSWINNIPTTADDMRLFEIKLMAKRYFNQK